MINTRSIACKLRLDLDGGIANGKQVVKRKTYSKIRKDIEDQDLYDLAQAILNLQKYDHLAIVRQDEKELTK